MLDPDPQSVSTCRDIAYPRYPPEIFNYSMRANGFAFMQFSLNALA